MFISSNGKEEQLYKVSIYFAIPFVLLSLGLLVGFVSVVTFKLIWSSFMIVNVAFMHIKNTITNYTSELNDD